MVEGWGREEEEVVALTKSGEGGSAVPTSESRARPMAALPRQQQPVCAENTAHTAAAPTQGKAAFVGGMAGRMASALRPGARHRVFQDPASAPNTVR